MKHYKQTNLQDMPRNGHIHHGATSKKVAREHERAGEKKMMAKKAHEKREVKRDDKKEENKEHRRALRQKYEKVAKTAKPGSGALSKAMGSSIAAEYMAKGKSPSEAKKIAGAIVGKQGRKKYGAKKMGQ